MKKIENTALQMIAEASRCPDYGPDMVKSLMKKLDMNEKGFALLMNVAPSTVRLWTSGAAQPCGTAKRLMQIYETGPEIVGKIAGGQLQEDGTEEQVEETYEVTVPLSTAEVYEKLSTWRGCVVSDEERSNAADIYAIVMGSMGGDTFNGDYESGGSAPIELDVSMLTDPTTKNAADLVTYVTNAWNSGWGYVWGTYGQVLTPELLQYKLTQYPDGVGKYAAFIRANWLGRHTADCVGLIKGYGWLSTDTMTIDYGTHGMPDIGANEMYFNATHKGEIATMPDTPGLAVWKAGHTLICVFVYREESHVLYRRRSVCNYWSAQRLFGAGTRQ